MPAAKRAEYSKPSGRRFFRHAISIPVTITIEDRAMSGETINIGYGGLFVRADETLALQSLVQVDLKVPPDDKPFTLYGRVLRAQADDSAGPSSMAVELFGTRRAVRRAWAKFVSKLDEGAK